MKSAGIILLALVMATGMNAQSRQGRGPGAGPFAALDLTEQQQEQLKTLHLEHYKEMKPLRNQMAELRLKKRNLMSEDDPDLKAIYSIIDEQTKLSNKIQKLMAENRVETKAVLTDEQLMKLDHLKSLNGRRNGPDGRGRGNKGGPGFHGNNGPRGDCAFRGGCGPCSSGIWDSPDNPGVYDEPAPVPGASQPE